MTRRTMTVAALAATVGGVAFHFYLVRFELEMAGGPSRPVLMTTRDLALGEPITRGMLDVKELPESYIEERHIASEDLERILGARATAAVKGGGTLLWTDLDTLQDGRTLAGLVRVGMRGFSLQDRDVSFDGLLRPGDRVDVVLTPVAPPAEAITLLSNVLVLTVAGDLGLGAEEAQRAREGVTLSVTPEQATLLAQREGTGRLRLTLRNPQDAWVPGLAQQPESARPPRTTEPSAWVARNHDE
jgi:pilus assembly protein CpaB